MKQTKVNFQNVAVLCDTWQQMLHLAELAREQGYDTKIFMLDEADFNAGYKIFEVDEYGLFWNFTSASEGYTIIPYTTFVNPPTDESVYGC